MILSEISNFKFTQDITFRDAIEEFVNKFGDDKFEGNNAVVITRKHYIWRAWFKDAGYEKFLKLASGYKSKHLPKILSQVRQEPTNFLRMPSGMVINYVKVEKLEALQPSMFSDAVDAVGMAMADGAKLDSIDDLLSAKLKIPSSSDTSLDEVVHEIKKHKDFFELAIELNNKAGLNDLSSDNVMMRGSIPVITDPISDND